MKAFSSEIHEILDNISEDYERFFNLVGSPMPLNSGEKGFAHGQNLWKESTVPGRFVIDHHLGNHFSEFDLVFLQKCADFNNAFNNPNEETRSKLRKAFLSKLKSVLEAKKSEAIASSLLHYQCRHAIKSCDGLEPETVVKMMKKYPEVMKEFLEFVPLVQDFSFMTIELAKAAYFSSSTAYLSPLKFPHFHETVSFDVVSFLLHRRGFDLSREEATLVIKYWATHEEFIKLSSVEPRVWLLWKTWSVSPMTIIPEFPLELFMENFSNSAYPVKIYSNLILAFIFDAEERIWLDMKTLEYIQVDLHKNDFIENFYMDQAMISALDSRKWNIWFEKGKPIIEKLAAMMAKKKKLIEFLQKYSEIIQNSPDHNQIYLFVILDNILKIAQVPLPYMARKSYLKSRNIDELIASADNYYSTVSHGPLFMPVVPFIDMLNMNYWTVLWKQLEVLEIELPYNEELTAKFENDSSSSSTVSNAFESDSILDSMEVIKGLFVRLRISNHFAWLAEIAYMTCGPMKEDLVRSEKTVRTLFDFLHNSVIDFSRGNLIFFKALLHPGTSLEAVEALECFDERFERFRLAPSTLTREEISGLMGDPNLKRLMHLFKANVKSLRYLDAFSSDDLIEFFPLGAKWTLDTCEALYTVNSDVLAGFLYEHQGAINYPDVLIWWMHPDAWNNQNLVDQLAPLINYYSIIRYEKDAEAFSLVSIITDITGRLERNQNEPVQVIIIKWLIQMEWIDFCFQNLPSMTEETKVNISQNIFKRFVQTKAKAHTRLVNWLNEKKAFIEDGEELLKLVKSAPLAPVIASSIFSNMLLKEFGMASPYGKISVTHNWDRNPIYDCFRTDTKLYKMRQVDLFEQVKAASDLCQNLVQKYFNSIEKQIALFRVKLMNILGETFYSMNPTPALFAYHLFHSHAMPLADLNVAYHIFMRLGLSGVIYCANRIGWLNASPEAHEKAQELIAKIQMMRKFLLTKELEKMKSAKK